MGTDYSSFSRMPLKPHECPFKLQKRAFRALRLELTELGQRFEAEEDQGNALCQLFPFFLECKNRLLTTNAMRIPCIIPPLPKFKILEGTGSLQNIREENTQGIVFAKMSCRRVDASSLSSPCFGRS